ncbi:MAG: cupin domain-containing protein, partial [Candidatus Omnitrophota bacterium]
LATLSRIENSKMTGTVKCHQAIASAFGLNLPQLYSDVEAAHTPFDYQPITKRTDLFIHNDKASFDMLTSRVLSKKMMPVMLKIAPGGNTQNEQMPSQTEKFLYVTEGSCEAKVGNETFTLKKGETLYLDASLAHSFANNSTSEFRAICVITPPVL